LLLPRTGRPASNGFLVAAPPDQPATDEEKEAITMAKQAAAKSVSAKQVAIDVLRAADGPLKAKEVAKRVIDSGRCSGLKGKTPEATISAMLAVGSKAGGPFKRVDKGTYTLAGSPTRATSGGRAPKGEPKPRTQKRKAKPPAPKRQAAKRSA
jgi:HB1, ASXL, restriction endonuclease HTH domain